MIIDTFKYYLKKIFKKDYNNWMLGLVSNDINKINLKKIDNFRFPVIKILNNLSKKDSLFETIIVSANDKLVKLFLNNMIKFTDISIILLKICNMPHFTKFKLKKPRNIDEINDLADYVSLKIDSLGV